MGSVVEDGLQALILLRGSPEDTERGEYTPRCLIPGEQDLGEVQGEDPHLRNQLKTSDPVSAVTLPLLTATSLSKC